MQGIEITYEELKEYYAFVQADIGRVNYFAQQISEVMNKAGMRFDEVGGEGWTVDTNNIRLLPRKGNDARIFTQEDLPTYYYQSIVDTGTFDRVISYSTYINAFRAVRPYPLFVGKKELLAHGFRYKYAREQLQAGLRPEQVRQLMGEKTMASAAIYMFGEIYK